MESLDFELCLSKLASDCRSCAALVGVGWPFVHYFSDIFFFEIVVKMSSLKNIENCNDFHI